MIISILLLAVSLSLDAFVVGLAYGFDKIKIPMISKLIICVFSIIYASLALVLGYSIISILTINIAKYIGIFILVFIGFWLIIKPYIRKNELRQINYDGKITNLACIRIKTLFKIVFKSIEITIRVIDHLVEGDINKSGVIELKESFLLGFALSIDSIGVGIGCALSGFYSYLIPFAIGIFQFLFIWISCLYSGNRFNKISRNNKKLFSIIPGVLLIIFRTSKDIERGSDKGT